MVLFLCWLVWRTCKKSKGWRKSRVNNPTPTRGNFPSTGVRGFAGRLIARTPILRNRFGNGWEKMDDGQPLRYDEKNLAVGMDYFAQDVKPLGANEVPRSAPQINTNVSLVSGVLTGSPTSTMLNRSNTPGSMLVTSSPVQVMPGHQANGSMSSVQAHYNSLDPGSTIRTGMGVGLYFNQSELARQPSDAYDPTRRQVNRTSELSSISSGFGDGDLMVPQGLAPAPAPAPAQGMGMPQPPPQTQQGLRQSTNIVGRFSWMSRGNRDTVYTETSEDSPPRFRSVTSWVNQQTGRVKRAQKRADEEGTDVPPVPGLPGTNSMPPEPEYGMMMPDGEVPKPVDIDSNGRN